MVLSSTTRALQIAAIDQQIGLCEHEMAVLQMENQSGIEIRIVAMYKSIASMEKYARFAASIAGLKKEISLLAVGGSISEPRLRKLQRMGQQKAREILDLEDC